MIATVRRFTMKEVIDAGERAIRSQEVYDRFEKDAADQLRTLFVDVPMRALPEEYRTGAVRRELETMLIVGLDVAFALVENRLRECSDDV